MTRPLVSAALLALPMLSVCLVGCDKQGIFPYRSRTDIVSSCGLPASVHLHSGDAQTDILIMGTNDPATPFIDANSHCMMFGKVDRDSTTSLYYGGYELDASGNGVFYVSATYEFEYEPTVNAGGREGAVRFDSVPPFELPLTLSVVGDTTTLTIDGATHDYVAFRSVVANIDLADPMGPTDLFQTYNLALLLSQVRVPAFGGLGMTRYIMNTTTFKGLVGGEYSVGVQSLLNPRILFEYAGLEDFPGVQVNGMTVADVNINANGTTSGVISFEIHDPVVPTDVAFAGTIDYESIEIRDGVITNGNYTVTTTTPTATTNLVSYTNSNYVDLTHILPVTP